jgi:histidinol-phosphate aminotransferase
MVNNNEFLQPREAVRAMRPYTPPTQGREHAMRLDFNENTIGCSPAVLAAITSALTGDRLAMYPEYNTALSQVAAFLDVPQDNIMLTNGTDEAIQVLVNTFVEPGSELLIPHPSYAMYRFYAEVAGVKVHEVDYNVEDGLRFPLEALLDAIKPNTRAIFVANPNNPTGGAVSLDEIRQLLNAAPNVLVLVDEAYIEFSGISALSLISQFPQLVISRTFSKAFGLAGLRCGCLISNSENIAWAKKAQSPYSVNVLAAVAASAAVQDTSFVDAYVQEVISARTFVVSELNRLGIRQFPTDANFVLIDLAGRAQEIVDRLRKAEILIRNRSHELPGCVRVTIGTNKQMQQFISELEKAI